jgi:hypothetical protein
MSCLVTQPESPAKVATHNVTAVAPRAGRAAAEKVSAFTATQFAINTQPATTLAGSAGSSAASAAANVTAAG